MAFLDVGAVRVQVEPDLSLFNRAIDSSLKKEHLVNVRADTAELERSINRALGKAYDVRLRADLGGIERSLAGLKLPALRFPDLKTPNLKLPEFKNQTLNFGIGGITSQIDAATKGLSKGISLAVAPLFGIGGLLSGAAVGLARGLGSVVLNLGTGLTSAFSSTVSILASGLLSGVKSFGSGLVGAADAFGKIYLGYLNQGLRLANKSVEKSATVESILAATQIKAGISDKELSSLKKQVLEVASRPEVTATPSDIARGAEILSQSGFNLKQIQATLPTLTLAGSVLKSDVGETASLVIDLVNKFQLKTEEIPLAINTIAASLTSAKISAGEFQTALQYFTPQGKGVAALQETASSFALIATSGQSAQSAGTGLGAVIDSLVKVGGEASNAAKIYSLFNTNVRQSDGSLRSEYEILLDLRKGYQALEQSRGSFTAVQKTSEIFGAQGGRVIASLAKLSDKQTSELISKTQRGKTRDFLGEFASKTAGTTAGSKTSLEGNIESFQISLGDAIAPIYKTIYSNVGLIFGQIANNEIVFKSLSLAAENFSKVIASPNVQSALKNIGDIVATLVKSNFDSIASILNSISAFLADKNKLQEFITVAVTGASIILKSINLVNQGLINFGKLLYDFLKQLSGVTTSVNINNPLVVVFELVSRSINFIVFNIRILYAAVSSLLPLLRFISGLVDVNFGGLKNIENSIKNTINNLAGFLIPILKNVVLIAFSIGQSIRLIINNLISSFKSGNNINFDFNFSNIISRVTGTIANIIAVVTSAIQSLISLIVQVATTGINTVVGLLSSILPATLNTLNIIISTLSGLFVSVSAAVIALFPYIQESLISIFNLIGALAPMFSSLLGFLVPVLGQIFAFALQGIIYITDRLIAVIPFLQEGFAIILPFLQQALAYIFGLVASIGQVIDNSLSVSMPAIANGVLAIGQLMNQILPYIFAGFEALSTVSAVIIPALLQGAAGLFSAISNIVNGIFVGIQNTQSLAGLIQAISDFTITVFASLQQSLSNIFIQSQNLASLGELIGQFLGYFLQLLNAAIPLVGSIFNLVFKILEFLIQITLLNPVFQALIKIILDGLGVIVTLIVQIADFLTNFLNSLSNSLTVINNYLTSMNLALAGQYKEIADFIIKSIIDFGVRIGEFFKYLFDLLSQTLAFIGGIFAKTWEAIQTTIEEIGKAFQFVFEGIGNIGNFIGQIIQNTWQLINNLFNNIYSSLTNTFSILKTYFDWIQDQLNFIWQAILNVLEAIKQALWTYIGKPIKDWIIDPTMNFISSAKNAATSALNSITNTIKNTLKPALDLVANTAGQVGSVFASWANPLQGAISTLGNVGSGIAGLFGGSSGGSVGSSETANLPGVPYSNVKKASNEGIFNQSGFSTAGVDFVKAYEGFNPKAFWDYAQYSIGFGTKAKSANATITLEEANQELLKELIEARNYVKSLVPNANANQVAALTSFTFNTGQGSLQTLVKNRSLEQIAEKILLYDKTTTGERLAGLTSRRQAERNLFLLPVGSGAGTATGTASSGISNLSSGIGGGLSSFFSKGSGGLTILSGGRPITRASEVNVHHNNSGRYGTTSYLGKAERAKGDRLVKDLVLQNAAGSQSVPISAVKSGIAKVGYDAGGYGNFVDLVDENGRILQRVAHGSKVLVKDGQRVGAGDGLIIQGNTGRSSGTHLHLEILPELFQAFLDGSSSGKFSGNASITAAPTGTNGLPQTNFLAEYQKQLDIILGKTTTPTKGTVPSTLPALKAPTLPQLKAPTLPQLKAPTLPQLKTPTLPQLKAPTLPELKAPSLPQLKAPSLPELKAPTLPQLKAPSLPQLKAPTLPELKAPSLPELKAPSLPQLKAPTLPQLKAPSLPQLKAPSLPQLKAPSLPELKAPSLPQLKAPSLPQLKAPTLPQLKDTPSLLPPGYSDLLSKVKQVLADKSGFVSLEDFNNSEIKKLQELKVLPSGAIASNALEPLLADGLNKVETAVADKTIDNLLNINTTVSDNAKNLLSQLNNIGQITLQQRELISDLLDKTISAGQLPSLKDLNQNQLSSLYRAGLLKTGAVSFGEGYIKNLQDLESQQINQRLQELSPRTPQYQLNLNQFLPNILQKTFQEQSAKIPSTITPASFSISFDRTKIRSALAGLSIKVNGVNNGSGMNNPSNITDSNISSVAQSLIPQIADLVIDLIEQQSIFTRQSQPF